MPGEMEDKSHLDFHPQYGKGCELAIFMGGQWKRSEFPDRFGQRLELTNETTVRIKRLEMEDSGLFKVSVRLPSAEFWYHTFNLTVYALVPEPQIHLHKVSDTTDKCHVTLWCQVPGEGGFKISWIVGQTLEGSEEWYQLSDNNRTLQLSWHPKLDSNIICQVSNPVDQKKASYDLLKICPNEAHPDKQLPSESNSEDHYVWIVLTLLTVLGFIVYAVVITVMCWMERKDVKRKERSADLSIPDASQVLKEKVPLLINPYQENGLCLHRSTGTEMLSQDLESHHARPLMFLHGHQ